MHYICTFWLLFYSYRSQFFGNSVHLIPACFVTTWVTVRNKTLPWIIIYALHLIFFNIFLQILIACCGKSLLLYLRICWQNSCILSVHCLMYFLLFSKKENLRNSDLQFVVLTNFFNLLSLFSHHKAFVTDSVTYRLFSFTILFNSRKFLAVVNKNSTRYYEIVFFMGQIHENQCPHEIKWFFQVRYKVRRSGGLVGRVFAQFAHDPEFEFLLSHNCHQLH